MEDASYTSPSSLAAQRAPPLARGHSAVPVPTQPPTSSSLTHQLHGAPPGNAFVSQFDMAQSSSNRAGPFNMNVMAAALPHVAYHHPPYGTAVQPQHGFYSRVSPSSQSSQSPQYGTHGIPVPNPTYYQQQGPAVQQYYPMQVYQAHPPPEPSQTSQPVWYGQGQMPSITHPQAPTAVYYYPTNTTFTAPAPPAPPPPPQMPIQYTSVPPNLDPRTAPPPIAAGSSGHGRGQLNARPPRPMTGTMEPDTMDSRQTVVRGPPRKPKQRDYAIWIGNLPPRTDLMSLVDHVCKEASGLESLFLISKSNCAFANFKDEQTCISAQQKLHESRFQTVRLVSRLRKSAVERPGILTPVSDGPTSSSSSALASDSPAFERDVEDAKGTSTPASSSAQSNANSGIESVQGKERYFILKSLTIEDLEMSVRNGIWATQSHNEETINAAFKASDKVYLFFSANKSGEYFGYARMTSSINEDPGAAIEFAPAAQTSGTLDLPKAIPTDASHLAPKGRIIDDSARGTIFWEVGRDDDDSGDEEKADGEGVVDAEGDGESAGAPKSWGKPFTLEWISTTRVPFYRTRGLRNPWNANREVKIARDGTELETNIGRRLVSLFNVAQSPGIPPPGMVQPGSGWPIGHR